MEQYRKPDQYYIDQFDRFTIKLLKEVEAGLKDLTPIQQDAQWHLNFRDKGILRAREKQAVITQWIAEDENKDRLIRVTPVPEKITCNECNGLMELEDYFFEKEVPILFLFNCPHGHVPKKLIYPNGKEFIIPPSRCRVCGYIIKRKSRRDKNIVTTTYTCTGCGKEETDELDVRIKPEKPISEKERQKYCSFSPDSATLLEYLERIYRIKPLIEEFMEKKELRFDDIEKLTIPQLEQRLRKKVEDFDFIKFQFDKPEIKRHVVVSFSVQDPTNRKNRESEKALTKVIKENLFYTNWRLMSTGITYRLGFLTGQLKAYEEHADLKKIAEEIASSTQNK